jgi:hypothetical protein
MTFIGYNSYFNLHGVADSWHKAVLKNNETTLYTFSIFKATDADPTITNF